MLQIVKALMMYSTSKVKVAFPPLHYGKSSNMGLGKAVKLFLLLKRVAKIHT